MKQALATLLPIIGSTFGSQEVNAIDARTLYRHLGAKTLFPEWVRRRIGETLQRRGGT